jgi:Ala-tRNA(Pro) deacylase
VVIARSSAGDLNGESISGRHSGLLGKPGGLERMELLHGAPDSMEGRQDREVRAYKLLNDLGIDFVRTDHPDEPATSMEVCEKVDAILGVKICKNLFLCNRQKTNFYLLVMPGDKPFKTKELSGQLGISRLSFGEPQFMEQFLDLQPGSVSVLGLMNDHDHRVRLLIDEDVLEEDQFGCHPCMNTSSIRFATRDLIDKILPAIGVGYTTVKLVGY